MLLRLGVENHRSISDRQELSFVATPLKDRLDGLLTSSAVPGTKLLPVAVIYGANASGKSNLVSAMRWAKGAVVLSHRRGEPGGKIPRAPFRLNPQGSASPTIIDLDFIVDGVRYHYGFEATDEAFTSEWLYSYPEGKQRLLFERRSSSDVIFGNTFRGPKKVFVDLMRPNSLFISSATQNNHPTMSKISSFFDSMVANTSVSVDGGMIAMRFSDTDVDQRTIDFLKSIGTGVVGYQRKREELSEDIITFRKDLNSLFQRLSKDAVEVAVGEDNHKTSIELAHSDVDGQQVYFDLDDESAGTRRLLVLLNNVYRALSSGTVLVVDELDASLHTRACEAVLSLFLSPSTNPNGAQLIATTHDTNLMVSKSLRRDEIWFTEKDETGATHLFPLSDIRSRKSDNIERGYLQGRYGAIPFAGSTAELFAQG